MNRIFRALVPVTLCLLIASACGKESAGDTEAVEFPTKNKSITFLVPYSTGGPADSQARVVASMLEKEIGTRVLVVNKPGGNTVLGLSELAAGKADGYSFGLVSTPNALAWIWPAVKAPYEKSSFKWFGTMSDIQDVIAVSADSDYESLEDVVADAKARPGKVIAAIEGAQSTDALATSAFEQAADIDLKEAIYATGGAEKVVALLADDIDVAIMSMATAKPKTDEGELRIIAALTKEPIAIYPDVPTATSLGYDVFSDTTYTLVVPSAVPKAIQKKLEDALQAISKTPEYKERISALGLTPIARTAAETTALVAEVEQRTTDALNNLK